VKPGRDSLEVFFYALLISITLIAELLIPQNCRAQTEEMTFGTVIDPDRYIVGPGDKFRIDFWDGSTTSLNLTVTPEGTVLLTSMGLADIGGVSLTEARQRLTELVGSYYDEIDFSISLVGVRPVKILVTGAIKEPGLYDAFVSQRVSEIIEEAGGLLPGASHRRILFDGNGHEQLVDLLRFERTGDLDANPYLYIGYKIKVPLVTDSSTFVQISGEVVNPCGVEYREGDNIGSIIDLAKGLTGFQGESVFVYRKIDGGVEQKQISIDKLDWPVMPGDKIIVSRASERRPVDYFSITGEIQSPGRYPYENKMTLADVIRVSGPLTLKADYQSMTIYRQAKYRHSDETIKMLSAINNNNLSFADENYPVSLRMNNVDPGDIDKISVFPGDSIVVPILTGSVGIYGLVKRPGLIKFTGVNSASDLIGEAGGYTGRARKDKIEVIRKSSGLKIISDPGIEIYDGDVVIIPEENIRKSTWDKVKDITLILAGAGVIYLAIDNIAD